MTKTSRRARIRKLDAKVVKAARRVRLLRSLHWPEDAEARFLASVRSGSPKAPGVVLAPPGSLPDDAELASLAGRFDRADPVQDWLGRTLDNIRQTVALLESIGTVGFVARSLALFGLPDDPVHPGAPSALSSARHFLRTTQRLKVTPARAEITDAEAAEWMTAQVQEHFPVDPPRVELDPHLVSIASAGSTRIRLRQGAYFSLVQLRQLLHHEALVHVATRRNGKAQPVLTSLGLSLPRTTATQEGLASLAELVSDTMDLHRLRRIALRVVAVHDALQGASFIDIWNSFREAGESEPEAFHSARRIFRGGDGTAGGGIFAKDAVYVGGLMRVQGFCLTAIRDGRKELPLRLFSGRLTPGDVLDLDEAFVDGTIALPAVAPQWVQALDCLAAFLTVSGLVTRIDLDAVELEAFSDRRSADPSLWGSLHRPGSPRA